MYVGKNVWYFTQDGENVAPQAAIITYLHEDGRANLFIPIFGQVFTGIEAGGFANQFGDIVVTASK